MRFELCQPTAEMRASARLEAFHFTLLPNDNCAVGTIQDTDARLSQLSRGAMIDVTLYRIGIALFVAGMSSRI
jgi:hypothetical protein